MRQILYNQVNACLANVLHHHRILKIAFWYDASRDIRILEFRFHLLLIGPLKFIAR